MATTAAATRPITRAAVSAARAASTTTAARPRVTAHARVAHVVRATRAGAAAATGAGAPARARRHRAIRVAGGRAAVVQRRTRLRASRNPHHPLAHRAGLGRRGGFGSRHCRAGSRARDCGTGRWQFVVEYGVRARGAARRRRGRPPAGPPARLGRGHRRRRHADGARPLRLDILGRVMRVAGHWRVGVRRVARRRAQRRPRRSAVARSSTSGASSRGRSTAAGGRLSPVASLARAGGDDNRTGLVAILFALSAIIGAALGARGPRGEAA